MKNYICTKDERGFTVIDGVSAPAVARQFCRVIREWLTDEQMVEVLRLNKAESSDAICHTHDFCDSNEAMAQAQDVLGLELFLPCDAHVCDDDCRSNGCSNRHEDETRLQDQCDLWNEAWSLAKRAEFDPNQIDAVVADGAKNGY